jgi:hypothetical protein
MPTLQGCKYALDDDHEGRRVDTVATWLKHVQKWRVMDVKAGT